MYKFNEERLFIADSFSEGMKWIADINTDKEKFVLIENDLTDNYFGK
mgnify:CR=1 FL=1